MSEPSPSGCGTISLRPSWSAWWGQTLAIQEEQCTIVDPPPITAEIDVACAPGAIWNQRGRRAEPVLVAERALAEAEDHLVTVYLAARLDQGRHDRAHVGHANQPLEPCRSDCGLELAVRKAGLYGSEVTVDDRPVEIEVERSRHGLTRERSLMASGSLEAAPGFEPGNKGFADPRLTTWLCRLNELWGGEL